MIYKSFPPCESLSQFVRNYTIIQFEFSAKGPIPSKQRAPKPEQKIVFYLKDLPTFVNPVTGSSTTPSTVSVFSHQSDQKVIRMTADFYAFIIFLQPGVLHRMIRLPMMELLDECCDAELFFGTAVRSISDQLASATSYSHMVEIMEHFLLAKCVRLETKSAIDVIADLIMADPTCFSLDSLAKQACLSSKQFHRNFSERIGIGPKLYSRLCRFNHAYRYKIMHPHVSWSSVAQQFEYTDYHHMEKEFKGFTSLTPQDWTNVHLAAPERTLRLR